jgi:hypothetical protein
VRAVRAERPTRWRDVATRLSLHSTDESRRGGRRVTLSFLSLTLCRLWSGPRPSRLLPNVRCPLGSAGCEVDGLVPARIWPGPVSGARPGHGPSLCEACGQPEAMRGRSGTSAACSSAGSRPVSRSSAGRVCDDRTCSTVLSIYNTSFNCWLHQRPSFPHGPGLLSYTGRVG